jgi:hypothetical protein
MTLSERAIDAIPEKRKQSDLTTVKVVGSSNATTFSELQLAKSRVSSSFTLAGITSLASALREKASLPS